MNGFGVRKTPILMKKNPRTFVIITKPKPASENITKPTLKKHEALASKLRLRTHGCWSGSLFFKILWSFYRFASDFLNHINIAKTVLTMIRTVECRPFDERAIFLLIPFSFESYSHYALVVFLWWITTLIFIKFHYEFEV